MVNGNFCAPCVEVLVELAPLAGKAVSLVELLRWIALYLQEQCLANPPYSCKKPNGDRLKKVVSVLRFSVTDALIVYIPE